MKGEESCMSVSKDRAKELSDKMFASISIQNNIYLADKKRLPSIGFFEDSEQYFDPQKYAIHLGVYGPIEIFNVETDEDYVAGVEYFFGHENQHIRSTARIPYENGIMRAAREIINYIAAQEGIRKNFRSDKDYDVFLRKELPASKGFTVSYDTLVGICSRLFNSVEDGRIERIRSLEFPGFERERRYFRAMVWDKDNEFKSVSEGLDDSDKLFVFLNAILSLATTGLYPKGFVEKYAGTFIMDEVQKFMPFIAKGVLAKRTRDMADNVVEIAKLLAPYIYSIIKVDVSAQKALEEMLKKLISQLISEMDPSKMSDTSEKEEETDDGIPMPVFPMSDLTITLDDETYDKLMERAKEKTGSGKGGIFIKREHPKPDESSDESQENGSNGNSQLSEDSQDGSTGAAGESSLENSDTESSCSNSSSGDSSTQSEHNGQDGTTASGNSSNSESNSSSDGDNNPESSVDNQSPSAKPSSCGKDKGQSEKKYSCGEGDGRNDRNGDGNHSAGGGRTGTLEMVKEQQMQAAKECRDDVSDKMENINQAIEHSAGNSGRGCVSVVQNTDQPITSESVKDILGTRDFKEVFREYKLDQPLPPLLNARAKAFRKKNERYFKSLSTPNVSRLDSGSVDPSLIFNLAIGDTDVFQKRGYDKKFNGCVYVLLDNSGSMHGDKRTEASKAAAVIEDGFKGIIPMKIVAFDTCGTIIHEVIKGWDESQRNNCCWNFAKHGRNGCGNDDGYDILIAQRELLARPEEKKLLIVLSDGAPASVEDTKKAIEATRKKGINVFGIYFEKDKIGEDANEFRDMYQKDYVCCKLEDVDSELTKLMIKFSRS